MIGGDVQLREFLSNGPVLGSTNHNLSRLQSPQWLPNMDGSRGFHYSPDPYFGKQTEVVDDVPSLEVTGSPFLESDYIFNNPITGGFKDGITMTTPVHQFQHLEDPVVPPQSMWHLDGPTTSTNYQPVHLEETSFPNEFMHPEHNVTPSTYHRLEPALEYRLKNDMSSKKLSDRTDPFRDWTSSFVCDLPSIIVEGKSYSIDLPECSGWDLYLKSKDQAVDKANLEEIKNEFPPEFGFLNENIKDINVSGSDQKLNTYHGEGSQVNLSNKHFLSAKNESEQDNLDMVTLAEELLKSFRNTNELQPPGSQHDYVSVAIKPKRGRPRKNPAKPEGAVKTSTGRRGRPPKIVAGADQTVMRDLVQLTQEGSLGSPPRRKTSVACRERMKQIFIEYGTSTNNPEYIHDHGSVILGKRKRQISQGDEDSITSSSDYGSMIDSKEVADALKREKNNRASMESRKRSKMRQENLETEEVELKKKHENLLKIEKELSVAVKKVNTFIREKMQSMMIN